MNAITFQCPLCGRTHGILISPLLLKGLPIHFQCPVTKEILLLRLRLEIKTTETFDKYTLRMAEEQARLEDHNWKMEEEMLRGKDEKEETTA